MCEDLPKANKTKIILGLVAYLIILFSFISGLLFRNDRDKLQINFVSWD